MFSKWKTHLFSCIFQLSYTNFGGGVAEQIYGWPCVRMYSFGEKLGRWINIGCGMTGPSICESSVRPGENFHPSPTSNPTCPCVPFNDYPTSALLSCLCPAPGPLLLTPKHPTVINDLRMLSSLFLFYNTSYPCDLSSFSHLFHDGNSSSLLFSIFIGLLIFTIVNVITSILMAICN